MKNRINDINFNSNDLGVKIKNSAWKSRVSNLVSECLDQVLNVEVSEYTAAG